MSSNQPSPGRRSSLAVVYGTVFLDLLGFGIILPSLPYWARTLGASGLGLGILLTSYSLAQLVGSPILGRLSDRFGRRPILLLALLGSTISMTLSAFAPTLVLLCATRALAGFFGGSIATAQAYIADSTSDEERPRFMGLLGASIGLGFVLGPALGAIVIALGYGFAGAALTAAVLAAANLVFALLKLRESPREPGQTRISRRQLWREARQHPTLGKLLWANFFVIATFVTMEATFAFLGADRFGLREVGFGIVLFSLGLLMVVVQGTCIGPLSQRFGVRRIAIAGGALMVVAMIGVAVAQTLALALVPLAVLSVGRGLASPSLSTMVSQVSPADRQGAILGLLHSMGAAARAGFPVLAGWLYDVSPSVPYWAGSLVAAIATMLLLRARLSSPTQSPSGLPTGTPN